MRKKRKEITGIQKTVKWTIYGVLGKIEFHNYTKRHAIKKYKELIKNPDGIPLQAEVLDKTAEVTANE